VLVDDGRLAALHYIKTSFFIDLIGSFPLNLILDGDDDNEYARLNKQLRLLRMAKLTRLLRLSKMSKYLKNLELVLQVSARSMLPVAFTW